MRRPPVPRTLVRATRLSISMKPHLVACALAFFAFQTAHADAPGPVIGIGTELKSAGGHAVVVQIVPGSPAAQAGVRAGDRLFAVDGHKVEGMSLNQIARLLRGNRDSEVRITVDRGGGKKEFAMKREILFLAGAPGSNP